MSEGIFFVVELQLRPGQVNDLRRIGREMVGLAHDNEPGTLNYEYFVTPDGMTCHIYERYVNPAAVLEHSKSFPNDLGKAGQAFRPVRLSTYGALTQEIREQRIDPIIEAVPGFSLVELQPLSGFAR